MALILPQRWTRQPQYKVPLDPKWVARGLNLALIPQGNGFVDCSNLNRQGSGGVRTQSTCVQGKTVLRTSGNYVFRGLLQTSATFSIIAVIKPTSVTAEGVVAQSSSAVTTDTIQFTIFDSQINLVCGNAFIAGASTNSGIANGKTSVVGVTSRTTGGTTEMIFYCDGKQLNTVSRAAPAYVTDGSGIVFVKQSGSDPFTGGVAFLTDFNRTLSPEHMIALTANPWQVFAPRAATYLAVEEAAGVTGTINVTLGNDTQAATGTTTVTGSLARTLSGDTSAISGNTTILGTIANTLANATSAITGTTTVIGSSSVTLADDTSAISGSVGSAVSGTIAVTLANDTSAITGTTTVVGLINNTLGNDTFVAEGTTPNLSQPIEGSGSGKYKWTDDELKQYTEGLGSGFAKKAVEELENAPVAVKKQVKALVKPYLVEKQIDFTKLEQDLTRFAQLIELYQAETIRLEAIRQSEIEEDDREFYMLMGFI